MVNVNCDRIKGSVLEVITEARTVDMCGIRSVFPNLMGMNKHNHKRRVFISAHMWPAQRASLPAASICGLTP